MQTAPAVTEDSTVLLVTEAYNLAEGQSEAAFLRAVETINSIATKRGNVAVAVVDPTVDNIAKPILAESHPHIEVWSMPNQNYDGQKNTIARNTCSDLIVYLDGDCHPLNDTWLESLIEPFYNPDVSAVGGLTLYDDFSLTGIAMSILDFGYLYGESGQSLGCYASNNVAFRRETLCAMPIPQDGEMRCQCYKHAQLLQRANKAVRLAGDAVVLHELPDIEKERFRRGYDHVSAIWQDPLLAEALWLAAPALAGARLLVQNYDYAMQRLRRAPAIFGLSRPDTNIVAKEIGRLLAIDKTGIEAAITFGESNGLNATAFDQHKSQLHSPKMRG
jgi:hypothetical protein